ncbi:MAG TPA: hypothetical protein VIU61_15345, partial [Kofleriaceae bacterium]
MDRNETVRNDYRKLGRARGLHEIWHARDLNSVRYAAPAMRAPIALSKTKLLSLAQCRRKLWLETYSPELVDEPSADKLALLATGNTVGELARKLYGKGGGHLVSFERGLRAAIDSTRALVAAGGREPIFEATFDHDGVSARIDIL